jgi:hypothetical protein
MKNQVKIKNVKGKTMSEIRDTAFEISNGQLVEIHNAELIKSIVVSVRRPEMARVENEEKNLEMEKEN